MVTITLSEKFGIELKMVTEIVLVLCEPTRLPHNLDKINYCIEQWHKSEERRAKRAMSPDTMEETLPEIIRALMPHNPTSGSIPANSCIICYGQNQSITEKCECSHPVRFHEEKRGLLAEWNVQNKRA